MALTKVKIDGVADGTDGQIITWDASGNTTAVGPGTDGQVLTSTGAGSPPAFEAAATTENAALTTGATFTGDVLIGSGSTEKDLKLVDNGHIYLGDMGGAHLNLIHNETGNSLIISTAPLYTRGTELYFQEEGDSNKEWIHCLPAGSVELSYNDNKKFETTTDGVSVTGDTNITGDVDIAGYIKKNTTGGALCTYIGDTYLRVYSSPTSLDDYKISLENTGAATFGGDVTINADSKKLKLGASSDLELYHDGSNSYIADVGTGELRIRGTTVRITNEDGTANYADFEDDGAVNLYYNNTNQFGTTSSGVTSHNLLRTNGGAYIYRDPTGYGSYEAPENLIEMYCQYDGGTNRGFKIGTSSQNTGANGNFWHFNAIHPTGKIFFDVGSDDPAQIMQIYNSGIVAYKQIESESGVQSGGNSTAGFQLDPGTNTALLGIQGKSAANGGAAGNAVFQTWFGADNTIRFNCDGSATFDGNMVIGSSTTANHALKVYEDTYGEWTAKLESGDSSAPHGLWINYSGTAPNGSSSSFITCNDTSSTKFQILSNGDVQSASNSYGSTSDVKLKQDITDASSQWNDIKAIKVRNFKFKTDTTKTLLGVVAQEVETVSPGLVYESPDIDSEGKPTEEKTKGVKYSILYMKAIKALQEAMTKIEALETDVAALKAA